MRYQFSTSKTTFTTVLILMSSLLLSACGKGTSGSGSGSFNNAIPPAGSIMDIEFEEQIPDEPEIESDQTSFFFSYDESASTASRDISLNSLANGRKPDPSLGRPFEFLNAENITTFSDATVGPFNTVMGLMRSENGDFPIDTAPESAVYGLGVNIIGPLQTQAERKNVVLTILLDTSGSMDGAYAQETAGDVNTLLDVAKVGLTSMQQSLKDGDIVNIVTFGTNATLLLEAHSPSTDSLNNTIRSIFTDGSTNINEGLNLAYQVANRTYDSNKSNRVIMVTDAFVNTGVIDPKIIADQTIINGLEGIHFSGVGVGSSFNDSVLNTITDIGKGSYSAMITPADANRIFTEGFFRFLDPAVRDVRFQLTYPQEMDQLLSFAEEISTVESEVRTINFSYNSAQFFLELFTGPSMLSDDSEIRLDVTYKDENGEPQSASTTRSVNAILGVGAVEIKTAAAITTLAQLINGSVSCDTVLSSNLYNAPVQTETYAKYKRNIDLFCAL